MMASPKWWNRLIHLLAILLISALSFGCASLPKVRILHDPLTAKEHLQLGLSYERQEELDLAISEYETALNKGGETLGPTPLIYLGNAHALQGDFDMAAKYYREALAMDAQNGEILNNLAWVYLQQGIKLDEAERLVKHALDHVSDVGPNRPRYLDTLAEIQIVQGRFAEALYLLQEAKNLIDQSPSSDEGLLLSRLYLQQARIYEALGQSEKADQARQRAEDLQ